MRIRPAIKLIDGAEKFMLRTRVQIFLAKIVIAVTKESQRQSEELAKEAQRRLVGEMFPITMRTEKVKILGVEGDVVTFRAANVKAPIAVKIGDNLILHWKINGIE